MDLFKKSLFWGSALLLLSACTDYVAQMEEGFGAWDIPCRTATGGAVVCGELQDARDGQKYMTVTIGSQTWMAQNLNYATEHSACYDDDTKICSSYGRLYTWAAAMGSTEFACGRGYYCVFPEKSQGVCPDGWHMPDSTEWEELIRTVGGASVAGKMLKSTKNWPSAGNGSDDYGFSALPAGTSSGMASQYEENKYDKKGSYTGFWSSMQQGGSVGSGLVLNSSNRASVEGVAKNAGLSVRCVKD